LPDTEYSGERTGDFSVFIQWIQTAFSRLIGRRAENINGLSKISSLHPCMNNRFKSSFLRQRGTARHAQAGVFQSRRVALQGITRLADVVFAVALFGTGHERRSSCTRAGFANAGIRRQNRCCSTLAPCKENSYACGGILSYTKIGRRPISDPARQTDNGVK
jgi:hypothetical protein